jgi:hypothetical protein
MDISNLLKGLKKDPKLLGQLSPREFEEVIAELLASFGWDVNLTKETKDGGYDIIAVSKDKSGLETSWVVECKKYRSDRKVGVDITRGVYGVKSHLGVSNAVVVTTSNFTKGARSVSDSRYDLQLVDYSGVLEWLKQYRVSPENKLYITDRQFYSCFISHSHKDEPFAEKLTSKLRENGIKVWYAPEDMLPGQKIHTQIKQAIKQFDKLLIVLSRESMESEWVKTEIRNARRREIEEKRRVLFPISIVPFEDIRTWECFDADTGKDLAVEIREYLIPDFSNWKNEKSFTSQFHKILLGLQAADELRKKMMDQVEIQSINGQWRDLADNDTVFFKQKGDKVVGFYNFDGRNQRIAVYQGTLRNRLFEYSWKWLNRTLKGHGRMILSEDGKLLSGDWWYDNSNKDIEHVGYQKVSNEMPSWLSEEDFKEYEDFFN